MFVRILENFHRGLRVNSSYMKIRISLSFILLLLSAFFCVRMRSTSTTPPTLLQPSEGDPIQSEQPHVLYRPWPPVCVVCVSRWRHFMLGSLASSVQMKKRISMQILLPHYLLPSLFVFSSVFFLFYPVSIPLSFSYICLLSDVRSILLLIPVFC
jgi:hypothetical protein